MLRKGLAFLSDGSWHLVGEIFYAAREIALIDTYRPPRSSPTGCERAAVG